MKENSEVLTRQTKSVRVQEQSEPEIKLVTPQARKAGELGGVCLPNCQPSCAPNIIKGPCAPDYRLPRPPPPPPPPKPN